MFPAYENTSNTLLIAQQTQLWINPPLQKFSKIMLISSCSEEHFVPLITVLPTLLSLFCSSLFQVPKGYPEEKKILQTALVVSSMLIGLFDRFRVRSACKVTAWASKTRHVAPATFSGSVLEKSRSENPFLIAPPSIPLPTLWWQKSNRGLSCASV